MKNILGASVLRAVQRALRETLPQRLQRILGVSLGGQHLGYAVVRCEADCVQLGCVKVTAADNTDAGRGSDWDASAHFPEHIAQAFRSVCNKYREPTPQAGPAASSDAAPWVVALRQCGHPTGIPSTRTSSRAGAVAQRDADARPSALHSTRYRMEGMLITALPLIFEVSSVRTLATREIQWLLAQRLQEPLGSAIDLDSVALRLVARFPSPTVQTPQDVTRTMSAAWATAYAALIKEQLEVIRSDPCIANAVQQCVNQCPKVQELREARDAHLQALCSSAGSVHQAYKSLRSKQSEAILRRLLFKMYSVSTPAVGTRATG